MSAEKYGNLPVRVNLQGTRNDDIYVIFDELTLGGVAYPLGTTARLLAVDQSDVDNTFTAEATFDPDSNNNLKKVSFKILKADNVKATTYDYDIEITYANGDVFTHVIGTLTIKADVG